MQIKQVAGDRFDDKFGLSQQVQGIAVRPGSDELLAEINAFIAAANMAGRANVALGIESQGFSAACGLPPLATPARIAAAA